MSTLSYQHQASNEPFLNLTVGQCLDITAKKYPDRQAVIICHQNISKTYAELKNDVDQLSNSLIKLGIKRGERIGIWSPNNYEWVLTQYAAAKLGLIVACINPAYQAEELAYCLTKVGVSILITVENFKTQEFHGILKKIIPSLNTSEAGDLKCERFPLLKYIIVISEKNLSGTLRFSDVFKMVENKSNAKLEEIERTIDIDDPYVIQFTSGTTGNPKAATISHFGAVNNANSAGRRLGCDLQCHRICLPLPLYHTFSFTIGSLLSVVHGSCAIYPSAGFSAIDTLKALQNEKATILYAVPTMIYSIINLPEFKEYDISTLKLGVTGGAPCSDEMIESLKSKLNLDALVNGYGSSETSPGIALGRFNDSAHVRAMYIGGPLEHTEIKVVNLQGETVNKGDIGELWTRGYHVMIGYWNDEAKTKEVITPQGWYKTGDLVTMNNDGYIKVIGRIKDMIIRGGENIYPAEIENFLMKIEKIAEVSIVGVPDELYGEEACACICLKPGESLTEKEIRDFCKNEIAYFKVPRYFYFLDSIPHTVSGKVKKFELQALVIKNMKF